ncbi:fungal hydrophobin-domain-containing protein [Mucidula mucida]|nr:fungal hydrophobin-domain-containing protein [Mucidula mucida]
MQFNLAAFTALALTTLVAATPANRRGIAPSDCSTAPIQCCDTVTTASDPAASSILSSIGVVVQDISALVGLTCSPITVIGVGGGECSASPVCCEDNSHGGLISIGCVPVTL